MEALFLKAGLPADKAKQTLKNEELSKVLASSLEAISKNQELTRENGMQVYSLVTKYVHNFARVYYSILKLNY